MDTQAIAQALTLNPITSRVFDAVYAADQLPEANTNGATPHKAYVANCYNSDSGVSHWIAYYQDKPDVVEIFDSYGMPLQTYNPKLMLPTQGLRIVQQSQSVQRKFSTVCGQHTIFFIFKRASGINWGDFIHLYTDNEFVNDKIVCQFNNSVFDLKTVVFDVNLLHQISQPYLER